METLKAIGQIPAVLILRMRYVPYIDTSGETIIEDIIKQCESRGSKIILSALQAQPMKVITKAGLLEHKSVFFEPNFAAAVKKAEEVINNV